jgi:ankyrin repeat protein
LRYWFFTLYAVFGASAQEQKAHSKEYELLLAVTRSDAALVRQWIDAGADINRIIPFSEASALARQYLVDNSYDLSELGRGDMRRFATEFLLTPLHGAVREGNIEIAKILLDAGADPNVQAAWGDSPLYDAVGNREFEAALFLLEAGADVNRKNKWDETVLYYYVQYLWFNDILPAIIAAGADIEAPGSLSGGLRTPLINAAYWANTDAVRILIDSGADIDARTMREKQPSYGLLTTK